MGGRIRFNQYMPPNGRRVVVESSEVTDTIKAKADALIAKGYRFESEILTTGEVFMDVMDASRENEIANELSPNGPEVIVAVNRLVTNAYARVFDGSGKASQRGARHGKA